MCAHTIKGAVETGRCKTVHETPGAAEEFPFVGNSNQYHQDCHIIHVCLCIMYNINVCEYKVKMCMQVHVFHCSFMAL